VVKFKEGPKRERKLTTLPAPAESAKTAFSFDFWFRFIDGPIRPLIPFPFFSNLPQSKLKRAGASFDCKE